MTESVQTTLYQKLSVPPALGAAKVWLIDESPLKGEVLPTCAAKLPLCPPLTAAAVPVVDQPLRSPLSKPPLTTPPGGGDEAVTVRLMAAVCEVLPAVPVMVTVVVPVAALEEALSVSVELLPAATLAGLKDAVTPEGKPEALSAMVPGLPLTIAVPIFEVPELPCCTLTEAGLALMEKSLVVVVPLTVSAMVEPCVAGPSGPVTAGV